MACLASWVGRPAENHNNASSARAKLLAAAKLIRKNHPKHPYQCLDKRGKTDRKPGENFCVCEAIASNAGEVVTRVIIDDENTR